MPGQAGSAWVAVANSSHCGALAYYGLRIAEAGMIGLVFSHVDTMVLPHGSKEPFCGTNPLCITAPCAAAAPVIGRPGALCLDMATSKVPWNTVANAATEGVPIEADWAVDADGNGTTDAGAVASLHPFGAYKGSGLGLLIDVLSAMLSDSPFGPDIPKMYGDLSRAPATRRTGRGDRHRPLRAARAVSRPGGRHHPALGHADAVGAGRPGALSRRAGVDPARAPPSGRHSLGTSIARRTGDLGGVRLAADARRAHRKAKSGEPPAGGTSPTACHPIMDARRET